MDVIEAINERRSIRGFKPDAVSKEVLVKVMEAAIHAPSWANTQPWEFAIVGGKVMDQLKESLHTRAAQDAPRQLEIPAPTFPEDYRLRSREIGIEQFKILGIGREDTDKRRERTLKGARFFDAPSGIIIYMDKDLGTWSVFDIGLCTQTIALAAVAHGLGTCIQAAVVNQPEVLRQVLSIPDTKTIVIGLSIGYPDWDDPINSYRSPREPLEKIATWHGF